MTGTLLNLASLFDVALWRDGGQRQARRNAWSAMVSDHVRARARAEAEAALRAEGATTAAGAPDRSAPAVSAIGSPR
jgi:hypothetical protein